MKLLIHRVAAVIATLCIVIFFTATILSELFGTQQMLVTVKQMIVFPGLFILVPAMALTGITGAKLAGKRTGRVIAAKKKRMPLIAFNGLIILMPAAIYLNLLATQGEFNVEFYVIQVLELIAGATNITLMSLNIRDGLKMSGRLRLARA
ncbi:hypothetical protein [Thalassotalea fusca]